jgi:hypothetical protein
MMQKEKVIVALSNEPEGSICQYLGAEISLGKMSLEKQVELKQALLTGSFFTEMAGNFGSTYVGSDFLNELMNLNEIYHKNGILCYEDTGGATDPKSLSTNNWSEDFDVSTYKDVKIPQEGVIVLNLRTEDCYFVANGEFNVDSKIDLWDDSLKTKRTQFPVGLNLDSVSFYDYLGGENSLNFSLMHSASINGELLTRDELQEEMEGGSNSYFSSHFIFKDGEFIGWFTSENNSQKSFPFHEDDGLPESINPNLPKQQYDSSAWQYDDSPVKSLLDKLSTKQL